MDADPQWRIARGAEHDVEFAVVRRSGPDRNIDPGIGRLGIPAPAALRKQTRSHRVAARASAGGRAQRQSKRSKLQPGAKILELQPAQELAIEEDIDIHSAHAEVVGIDERAVVLTGDAEAQTHSIETGVEIESAGIEDVEDDAFVKRGTTAIPGCGRSKLNAQAVASGVEWNAALERKTQPLRAGLVVVDQRKSQSAGEIHANLRGHGLE